MRFEVLGPVQLHHNGRPLVITPRRESQLLAILLVRPGTPIDPAALIDAIWGSAPTQDPNRDLRVNISRLRGRLDSSERIQLGPRGYALEVEPGELDAAEFADLVQRSRTTHHEGNLDATGQLLDQALKLWRGVPYAGLDNSLSAATTVYLSLTDTVRRLTALYVEAMERRADIDLDRGEHERLIADLPHLVAEHPYHERFVAQLMTALDRAGRRAEALKCYETIRARLADDLGVDPGAELQQHFTTLLAGGEAYAPVRVVAQQLPSDTDRFTGRAEALAALDELLPRSSDAARPIVIAAVHGTGGIGKTALAVHWAHRVRGRFPDGQLFINLRGYGPDEPMTSAVALDLLLRSLDVPGKQIPADLDARSALFRSRLADRRMLIVLDNARDADQVRPLLPGSSSLVVATSRNQLHSLEIRDGAHRITLDQLQPAESIALLKRLLPTRSTAYSESALAKLASMCGHLPLALRIAAHRVAQYPGTGLDELLCDLRQQPSSALLEVLDSEDPSTSVRAVFSWSSRAVDPDSARMFRLLGAHPGPGITLPAAAALIGSTPAHARRLLSRLLDAHLVERRQYPFEQHDLIRTYAAELADTADHRDDRDAALRRVFAFYVHSGANARVALGRPEPLAPLEPLPDDVAPLEFGDDRQALAWIGTMRETTVAAVHLAADRGLNHAAYQLAQMMSLAFILRWADQDLLQVQELGMACARRAGDVLGEGASAMTLATAYSGLGDYPRAITHHERANVLFEQAGSLRGQAEALEGLGKDYGQLGRCAESADWLQQSVELARRAGDERTVPRKLNNLAMAFIGLRQYDDGVAACRQAIALCGGSNRMVETHAWDTLGQALTKLGKHNDAVNAYQKALDLSRGVGGLPVDETIMLTHLARAQQAAGQLSDARCSCELALGHLDSASSDGNPDARREDIVALLSELNAVAN